jgi:hypothetical protein
LHHRQHESKQVKLMQPGQRGQIGRALRDKRRSLRAAALAARLLSWWASTASLGWARPPVRYPGQKRIPTPQILAQGYSF